MSLSARLDGLRVVLAANVVDGYPSEFEYTRDFLLRNGVDHLRTIASPLEKRSQSRSTYARYESGQLVREVSIPRPNRPPLTFALDLLVPIARMKYDLWIGFNPFMSAIGAMSSSDGALVNWAIDFVPARGEGGLADSAYRGLERLMMRRLDVQIENTSAAMNARVKTTGITPPLQLVAPIGVWESSFDSPNPSRHSNRSVVYFGSLDDRNGVRKLGEIVIELLTQDSSATCHVIGDGPGAGHIKEIGDRFPHKLTFHGYMKNQRDIDAILRHCNIALAPYDETPGQFTQFADPQKLKYYAANGLPTLLTNVAPPAFAMEKCGAAILLKQSDPASTWVSQILELLNSKSSWYDMATRAHTYAKNFERNSIYNKTFNRILDHLNRQS